MQMTRRNVPDFPIERLIPLVSLGYIALPLSLVPMEVSPQVVNAAPALLLVLPVPDRHQMTVLCALKGITSSMEIASQQTVTVSVRGQMECLQITSNLHATVSLLQRSHFFLTNLCF